MPLYESDERTVKSELATFFEAFPYATIWANTVNGHGYDMVFMGHLDPPQIDLDQMQQRLDRADYAQVAESLREIGVGSAVDLLSTYAGRKSDLGAWSAGAEINTRWRPAPAIPGGMGHQLQHGRRSLQPDAASPASPGRVVYGLARTCCGVARVDFRPIVLVTRIKSCVSSADCDIVLSTCTLQ